MALVYLMVVSHVDDHHPIHEPTICVHTRAFVSSEVRVTATKRFIDDLLARFDITQIPEHYRSEVQDSIDDMLHARHSDDLSYELLCCRGVFGLEVEHQDVAVELEELVGEIVN